MYAYIFLIDFLKQKFRKSPDSLSELERYIIENIQKDKEDQWWFPCFYYDNEGQEEKDEGT